MSKPRTQPTPKSNYNPSTPLMNRVKELQTIMDHYNQVQAILNPIPEASDLTRDMQKQLTIMENEADELVTIIHKMTSLTTMSN